MNNEKIKVSKLNRTLLERLLPAEVRGSGLRDFEQRFNNISKRKGKFAATLWFWLQVFQMMPSCLKDKIFWSLTMFKNYMKIALRNIRKYKGFTFINISGLAVGLGCFIIIMLNVRHEFSFDRFHKNSANIFRVNCTSRSPYGIRIISSIQYPVSLELKTRFPEILESTNTFYLNLPVRNKDEIFRERACFTNPSFFNIFSFGLISGEKSKLLSSPNSMVISENTAKKYFGDQNPLGKVLILNNKVQLTISGVIRIPNNSDFQAGIFLPFRTLDFFGESSSGFETDWVSKNFDTFILLKNKDLKNSLQDKIAGLLKEKRPNSNDILFLQELHKIHLYLPDGTSTETLKHIYVFIVIGISIIFIGCINFMNLSTARFERRFFEIGLRKIIGANRSNIILQFLFESVIFSFFAFVISLILVKCFLPFFNIHFGQQLNLNFNDLKLLSVITAIVFLTGLISGSYPALFLSSFHPVNLIRGKQSSNINRSRLFRKILVIFQLSFSAILIICLSTVFLQTKFLKNTNPGFDKEYLVYIRMAGESRRNIKIFKEESLKNPDIISATACKDLPFRVYWAGDLNWEGKPAGEHMRFAFTYADYDYITTLKMDIKTGRNFSKEYMSDKNNFILNEEAVKQMNIESPIGKKFDIGDELKGEGEIIGIVKNFHCRPLREKIPPLVIALNEGRYRYLVLRIEPVNPSNIIKYLGNLWKRLNPNEVFDFYFFDKVYENIYQNEEQFGKILLNFTVLALFISCLGLFGLVSFYSEQKTREIGIRKVLGAKVSSIINLLTMKFIVLSIISNIIAWPIAFFIMQGWLQNFEYRVNINPCLFLLTGLVTLIVTVLTVSWQTIKAATANPVDSLRNE